MSREEEDGETAVIVAIAVEKRPFFFSVFSRRGKGGGVHAVCHRPLL